ncbi:MAG: hypothetical protein AAFP19_01700 [Bacteroidota bacterium]
MSLQVSFRVVGLYCYFENLQVPNVDPNSTVKEVMDQIVNMNLNFDYKTIEFGDNKKLLVDEMSYTFTDQSRVPYNSSTPSNGPRDLSNVIAGTSLVWQYYRSATGSFDGGAPCEIKYITSGQPSFADTPMNAFDSRFGAIPPNFNISTYNLTWRIVQIQMAPELQARFMAAKAAAYAAR